jgi:hypothetical protein
MTQKMNKVVEQFLKSCNRYQVLHEQSPTNTKLEHYFIAVTALEVQTASMKDFLRNYQDNFPLLDIAETSQKYINNNKHKFYFLFLDTLDKSDLFFAEKERHLKQSVGNIISIRMYGAPVDLTSYIESQTEKYFTQFKNISESIASIAKDEITSGLKIGAKKINEKAPIVKKKLEELKNKVIKLK